jgi:hypothetical protein
MGQLDDDNRPERTVLTVTVVHSEFPALAAFLESIGPGRARARVLVRLAHLGRLVESGRMGPLVAPRGAQPFLGSGFEDRTLDGNLPATISNAAPLSTLVLDPVEPSDKPTTGLDAWRF